MIGVRRGRHLPASRSLALTWAVRGAARAIFWRQKRWHEHEYQATRGRPVGVDLPPDFSGGQPDCRLYPLPGEHMLIGLLKETLPGERRVALVPAQLALLAKQRHEVLVERDAGAAAGYPDADYLAAGARIVERSEVFTGANARVTYGAVDNLSEGVTVYVNRRGMASGRDSKIEWALGLMNDGDVVSENITKLMGDGTFGDTKSVVVGRGNQTENFTTSIIHFGKNSEGYILKHGVMKDAASSIFNGIGKIEKGASGANAVQESRVLMLSEKARGDANPILLIDEDDVMAGHAASVGRVDPMQLYYLMSRGISKSEAERLVIHGFLAPVVEKLPIEAVKRQLIDIIERKVR